VAERSRQINIFTTGLTPPVFDFYSPGRIGGRAVPDADTHKLGRMSPLKTPVLFLLCRQFGTVHLM
jgi:hypothetical protein